MKKYLLILILSFSFISSWAFYYDYWNGALYTNGPYVNDLMSSYPQYDRACITIPKQYITDNKLSFSSSLYLRWNNFHRKLALNHYWASWYIVGFKYTRNVYVSKKSDNNYKEIPELRVEDGYFDVSQNILYASDGISVSSYSSQANSAHFDEIMTADVSNLSKNIDYKVKVIYVFTPVPNSGHDGYHYNPAETERYVKSQIITVLTTPTQSTPVFKVASIQNSSVINVNGFQNPLYDTGSGERHLIYNSPDAVISVMADTLNLPKTKTVVSGTNSYTRIGYGTFLASIGSSSTPSERGSTNMSFGGCGIIDEGCSRGCNGVDNKYFVLLNDMPKQKNFLKSNGYPVTGICFHSFTNILRRSLNSDMTMYGENTVEEYSSGQGDEYRMSRVFHLRDLSNVNTYTGIKYGTGTVIKVQHSTIYESKLPYKTNDRYRNILALGYEPYGPSYTFNLAGGAGITSNIIPFEIVSPVIIPVLNASEKGDRLTCVTDSLNREGDFIHLEGKAITCGNYSSTLYAPVYMWEVSFDGVKWEPITSENYSKYIIDRYNVKFAVVMDKEKDLLLKSTILKNKSKAMFRQMVVLRSFASPEYSTLYNYEEDGLYYIAIHGSSYYTYIPVPILDKDNISFNPTTFPLEQHLCKGDALTGDKLEFKLAKSTNVSTAEIEMMKDICSYKIYELVGDSVGKVVSNSNKYTMNWKGEDIGFRCVISWCRDSLYKDVHVYVNPVEEINLQKLKSNVVIGSVDTDNSAVTLLCQKGGTASITVNDDNHDECTYLIRRVVEYVAPEIEVTDFTKMSRSKIISFMKAKDWDFEKETGTNPDDAGLNVLRAWCRVKEDSENSQLLLDAEAENKRLNEWHPFESAVSTSFGSIDGSYKNEELYIRKQNNSTLCQSRDVKIGLMFFDGLVNNTISFASASNATKDTLYLAIDTPSPAIKGMDVEGGYGSGYSYKYIYREPKAVWQTLTEGSASLPHNVINLDRNIQVARVAFSRKDNDPLTQVCDTSNILTLMVYEEIDSKDIVVSGSGQCAGTVINAGISNYDPPAEMKKRVNFVWYASDKSLNIVTSGDMNRSCSIYNTTESFDLFVYREEKESGIKTTPVKVPVEVVSIKPSFSITVNGIETNILDYPDETYTFQSGTRFLLNNKSTDADSYLWNLELQYYTGVEVEGLTSYIENPVCYLYNDGQNKIRLTAKNSLGCEGSVTAENIYIRNSGYKSALVGSHFVQDEHIFNLVEEKSDFEVYPTVTTSESVKVFYSGDRFHYVIVDIMGRIVYEGDAFHYAEIPFEKFPTGFSTILLTPQAEGSVKENTVIFRILRK